MHEFFYWLHVVCVYVSIGGFLLRGVWMLQDSPLRHMRPVRVLPHVIDTGLLIGAIGLAVTLSMYPFTHGWVTAKVFALLAYIGFGLIAFRFGPTPGVRATAFAAALLSAGYLLAVAYTRQPWPLA